MRFNLKDDIIAVEPDMTLYLELPFDARGWCVQYEGGREAAVVDTKPGYWLVKWQEKPETQSVSFRFRPERSMILTDKAAADHIKTELGKHGIKVAVVEF